MVKDKKNICSINNLGIDFSQFIKEQFPIDEKNIYFTVYNAVNKIMKAYREAKYDKEPAIDVYKLAEFLDIKVVERSIVTKEKLFKDEIVGFIDQFDFGFGNDECMIYVNENIGELSKRYVIGHEIGHYILNNGQQKNKVEYCRSIMFPKNIKERICDLAASFILMPIEYVMKVMDDFCEDKRKKEDIPIEPDDWLYYVGSKFKLSNYHTILCYQDIRNLAGVLYSFALADKDNNNSSDNNEIRNKLLNHLQLFR